jgi:hypothetical protein
MTEQHAGAAGQPPECQTCPLCAGLAALRGSRSEAVEHLVKAGAELLLAAKVLLDGVAQPNDVPGSARRRARPPRPGDAAGNGLQRIDIG